MSFVRKFFLVILLPLLFVLLVAFAIDAGILHVVRNPQTVKNTLANSGIYNNLVDNALEEAQQSAGANNPIPLTNPVIKSAAETVFAPQVVKQVSNQAVDGIYDWLNGKSAQPDFKIDLTAQKTELAQKVSQAAQNRAASLPTCRSVPASTNPLQVTCLPPGLTTTQVGQQAKDDVLNAQGFLENPVITASSIKKSGSSQSVFSGRLQNAPRAYQRAKKSPEVFVILIIFCVGGILLLSTSKRRGLMHIGVVFVLAGVFVFLVAVATSHAANHQINVHIQIDNKILRTDATKVAQEIMRSISKTYWVEGGVYFALGVLAIGGALLIKGGNKKLSSSVALNGLATSSHSPTSSKSSKKVYKTPKKSKNPPSKLQG